MDITLVITIKPLFSFARNSDESKVEMVIGMIDIEIIGTNSKDSA
jgi:hypothetical protein